MPTLLLSARQTDDAQLLWRASIAANWDVVRVHGWQVPSLPASDVAIYGEPLFAQHVAQTLGLRLVEPPLDWLPRLPARWRGRDVRTRMKIPKGFHHSAQGCEERATLGDRETKFHNSEGVASGVEARL